MTEKTPAGMVRCTVDQPSALGRKAGDVIFMHPTDALEHHNLGIVKADPKFIADLEALDSKKRKEQ